MKLTRGRRRESFAIEFFIESRNGGRVFRWSSLFVIIPRARRFSRRLATVVAGTERAEGRVGGEKVPSWSRCKNRVNVS